MSVQQTVVQVPMSHTSVLPTSNTTRSPLGPIVSVQLVQLLILIGLKTALFPSRNPNKQLNLPETRHYLLFRNKCLGRRLLLASFRLISMEIWETRRDQELTDGQKVCGKHEMSIDWSPVIIAMALS